MVPLLTRIPPVRLSKSRARPFVSSLVNDYDYGLSMPPAVRHFALDERGIGGTHMIQQQFVDMHRKIVHAQKCVDNNPPVASMFRRPHFCRFGEDYRARIKDRRTKEEKNNSSKKNRQDMGKAALDEERKSGRRVDCQPPESYTQFLKHLYINKKQSREWISAMEASRAEDEKHREKTASLRPNDVAMMSPNSARCGGGGGAPTRVIISSTAEGSASSTVPRQDHDYDSRIEALLSPQSTRGNRVLSPDFNLVAAVLPDRPLFRVQPPRPRTAEAAKVLAPVHWRYSHDLSRPRADAVGCSTEDSALPTSATVRAYQAMIEARQHELRQHKESLHMRRAARDTAQSGGAAAMAAYLLETLGEPLKSSSRPPSSDSSSNQGGQRNKKTTTASANEGAPGETSLSNDGNAHDDRRGQDDDMAPGTTAGRGKPPLPTPPLRPGSATSRRGGQPSADVVIIGQSLSVHDTRDDDFVAALATAVAGNADDGASGGDCVRGGERLPSSTTQSEGKPLGCIDTPHHAAMAMVAHPPPHKISPGEVPMAVPPSASLAGVARPTGRPRCDRLAVHTYGDDDDE